MEDKTASRVIKHFNIDAGEVEQLIEIWRYFNKQDEPEPNSEYTITVNKKIGSISNYQFLHLVKFELLDKWSYWQHRFSILALTVLMEKPTEFLYTLFNKFKNDKKI